MQQMMFSGVYSLLFISVLRKRDGPTWWQRRGMGVSGSNGNGIEQRFLHHCKGRCNCESRVYIYMEGGGTQFIVIMLLSIREINEVIKRPILTRNSRFLHLFVSHLFSKSIRI